VGVVNALSHLQFGRSSTAEPRQQASAVTTSTQFADVDAFYATYDNALLAESERLIRAQSDRFKPGDDREKVLVRFCATTLVLSLFEQTWINIFRSQLKALERLNIGSLKIEDLRPFYEEAATKYPDAYKNGSFELWLLFLRSWTLILEQGETVHITVRGKEFLKWLVQVGRTADMRFA
jgi:hypothetical protein